MNDVARGRACVDGQAAVEPFRPARLLAGPHLQSIMASALLRRRRVRRQVGALLTRSTDVILDCGDGVRLHGYHAAAPTPARGLAVLIHGWEGSADSPYVMSAAQHLHDRGFDVFRLNLRDHGPSHHLNPEIFHSNRIAEVVGAVASIQDRYRPQNLFLAGFSLGGNFSLRVAARARAAGIRLRQVVAVCPVLDPACTLSALEDGWFAYRHYFVRKWRRSLRRKQSCFPDLYDFSRVNELATLTRMTEHLVEYFSGYATLEQYLRGYAITEDALAGLDVASHIIAAADDPIIPVADLERLARPPELTITVTDRGGHCGFFESAGPRSWVERQISGLFERALAM